MEIKKIPISLVQTSPMNPRKTFDEDALQELADNIEKQGLLQPITVRTRPEGKIYAVIDGKADYYPPFEIICGERRYRAFRSLWEKYNDKDEIDANGELVNPFFEIMAIVREMNDDEAFDAMITENLQRKDVDPMEEAFAFGKLIDKGNTAEEIATRFGKSIRFVQDRVKLNSLIPELMLAVKDGKMPIVAAQIICKLSEEDQKKYANSYQASINGYTKATAESFINSLFMKIDRAPWYETDDQSDEDFEDGCGVKCSECQFNTANHGCLFWDMKNEDAGKCTNREKFYAKHTAFILSKLEKFGEKLVKKGQPLETGKIVIIDTVDYCSSTTKELKSKIFEEISNAGYEVVNAGDLFEGKCWDKGEILTKKKKQNKVYKCLKVFNYDSVTIEEEYWYFKGCKNEDGSSKETASTSSQSVDAMKLMQKRSRLKDIARENLTKVSRDLATKLEKAERKGEISENEQLAFDIAIFTLMGNKMLEKYGHKGYGKPSDLSFIEIIKQNRADRANWMRELVRNIIASADITYNGLYQRCAELVLKEWMPDEFNKSVKEIGDKLLKDLKKNEDKLREIGYDKDGKLLPQPKEDDKGDIISIKLPNNYKYLEQYNEMKKKHPDCILLFRVDDFYEVYEDDALKVSNILGINTTSKSGLNIPVTGFPHHALDSYLPKIIKAGKRVVLLEELEEPKKTKKK